MVVLPVNRGGRKRRLDAAAITQALRDLVAARRLDERFCLREGCAGGCGRAGPNVDARIHPVLRPGEKPDHVAIGWKTYVYSLASLDCLATIIDENLRPSERISARARSGSFVSWRLDHSYAARFPPDRDK